ncbi:AAA family ATPase [Candidatus Woesearchaeota archaeon]|nr:AAA family ATPase [Candidatus Woesearchaeota archaeon]
MNTQIIGIISIKGGVGKTTTTANLGSVIAKKFNKKVLIVDANFSGADLGLHFGILKKQHTINGAIKNKYPIEKTILNIEENLDIIPASLIYTKINPLKLKEKIQPLKEKYDIILLDGSPNLDDEIISTIHAADKLIIVATPEHTSLSCTLHAIRIAKKKQTPVIGIILNRIKNKKFELTLEETEETTKLPVIAALPEDIHVGEALSQTIPITSYKPEKEISQEYLKLAAVLINEKITTEKKLFNIKKIPKQEINRSLLYPKSE